MKEGVTRNFMYYRAVRVISLHTSVRIICGILVALTIFSLINGIFTGLLLPHDSTEMNETILIGDDTYAIFYNAFINPDNVYLSLGVIVDQLTLWQASRYASVTLHYMQLGDTSVSFPCPANGKCRELLDTKSQWEEATLGPLYDFCLQNPDHNVIYLHSKGTLTTSREINHKFRNLLTLAALSDECYDGLHNDSFKCNVCSARFSPVPGWHNSGNMWTTKCSFVAMHYPIMDFEPKLREISDYYLRNFSNYTDYPEWSVGTGRFANEQWIHTHPQVRPCDVYTDVSFVAGYPDELAVVIPPFSLETAPRHFPALPSLVRNLLPGPQVTLTYRLYELQQLYGTIPSNDSFAWTWYQQQYPEYL
jgi:hypothetical protein